MLAADINKINATGLQYARQGLYAEAIVSFKQVVAEFEITNDTSYPVALFNLGDVYSVSGQYTLAIETFLRSLVYAPQYDLTRKNIAAIMDPCLATQEEPNIARLLLEFKDKMGWHDVLTNPSSTKEFLHFMQAARLCKADSIAFDISAGFGRNKPFFAHAEYVSIDLEVSTGWDFSTLDLIGDALNLPIKENSVDLIISSSSLEHYTNPFKAFHEFARVLKPGGSLYLDVPFSYVEHQIPHDYFRVSRYGLNHLCKEFGLDVVSIEPDCGGPSGGLRILLEVLEYVYSGSSKGSEDHKVFEDTLQQLKGNLKPIFDRIDCQHQRSGVDDTIQNCSQYPVRYNLIATKPGKLGKPKHYADRAALLQDIAECPACHQSGLVWEPKKCRCEKCGKNYQRNDNGIPELLIA